VKIIYVDSRGTSKHCSICGCGLNPNGQRKLWCPNRNTLINRDVNAARNILARGVRFAHDGPAHEAMVEEPSPEVILKVDAGKLTLPKS